MFAIETKFLPATNSKGARIGVRTASKVNLTEHCPAAMTIPYDHALSLTENHRAACMALLSVVYNAGTWIAGETRTGYVFCRVPAGVTSTARPELSVNI